MPDKSLRKDYYKTSGIVSFYVASANTFSVGQCVRVNNSGVWVLAQANNADNLAQGIVIDRDATSFTVAVSGPMVLSTTQWDAVAGTNGGLTPGTKYYLSASNPGSISAIEPVINQVVLQAVTSTTAFLLGFITVGAAENTNIGPQNPVTLNLNNINTVINLANYATTSFRINNPAQISLNNGINGLWYTLVVNSDGAYSFANDIEFPFGAAPAISATGGTDIYSIHCVVAGGITRYIVNDIKIGVNNPSPLNPITLNLNNTNTIINLKNYSTTSFRILNPAQITLSNGIDGVWYTFVIKSDGAYSFTSEIRFPLDNSQPNVSANGKVDIYSMHCVVSGGVTRYIATFGFQYTDLL